VLEFVDTTYDSSEKLVLDLDYNNYPTALSSIDNIIVDDEILITPLDLTTTTEPSTSTSTDTETPTEPGEPFVLDPMILAFGGGAVVLLVVAVVIIKRK
jgi:hypothetical protein